MYIISLSFSLTRKITKRAPNFATRSRILRESRMAPGSRARNTLKTGANKEINNFPTSTLIYDRNAIERGKFNRIINGRYQNFKGSETFYAISLQLYAKQCKSRYELYVKADTILRARCFLCVKYIYIYIYIYTYTQNSESSVSLEIRFEYAQIEISKICRQNYQFTVRQTFRVANSPT